MQDLTSGVTPEETQHGASRREMLATASVIASYHKHVNYDRPGRAGRRRACLQGTSLRQGARAAGPFVCA